MKIVGREFRSLREIDAVDAQPRFDGGKGEDMLPFWNFELGKQQPDPLELRAVSKEPALPYCSPLGCMILSMPTVTASLEGSSKRIKSQT